MIMYKLTRSTPVKICLAALLSITITGTVFLLTLIFSLGSMGLFTKTQSSFRADIIEPVANSTAYEVMDMHVHYDEDAVPYLSDSYDSGDYPDFDFAITINGKTVLSDKQPESEYICSGVAKGSFDDNHVKVESFLKKDMATHGKTAIIIKTIDIVYPMRYAAVAIAAGLALLSIFLIVILIMGAGRRELDNDIHDRRILDHIPADIYLAAVVIADALLIMLGFDIAEVSMLPGLIALTLIGIVCTIITMAFLMSIAVQIKQHRLLRETLTARILMLAAIGLRSLPVTWKLVVPAAALWLLLMVLASQFYSFYVSLFVFIIATGILVLTTYSAIMMRRLEKGAAIIASGDTAYTIKTGRMYGPFKKHADNLNSINQAIDAEVAERMKSERFKTELITNVSHDIKTPLTSIISYTDLLAAEDLDNENAAEYIEIIAKNAARLKKLTSDIVEASKASTGNLKVTLSDCNMGVILNQALGEYDEKMRDLGLTPIVSIPEDDITVLADGEHTWRIIDNIMNNICKYAQPDTRVYMDAYEEGDRAFMSFKNISARQLNISAEELMERFVRGDASRNTEGSGLGLSIARNLAALQGGSLDLSIDGDLFKVTVQFRKPQN